MNMMAMDDFYNYLKRQRRKDDVAHRATQLVKAFIEFQFGRGYSPSQQATEADLDAFVEFVEREQANLPKYGGISSSANSFLWAIRYYFKFFENKEMERYASLLREERIKRTPFKLKDFRGVNPQTVAALKQAGINNINQMLRAGKTNALRLKLARKTGIPEAEILELTRLSDPARIPGIKGVRARLYVDAGINSVEKMANMQEEEILAVTTRFVEERGFEGIPPLPGEVRYSIVKAKALPQVVEYD